MKTEEQSHQLEMPRKGGASVSSFIAGEHALLSSDGGTDERRARILARARATIERVEKSQEMERAAPLEEEEFDLQSYLAQFPMPLNGSAR